MTIEDELRANEPIALIGMIETGEIKSVESLEGVVEPAIYAEVVAYFEAKKRPKRSKLEVIPAYESACMVAQDMVQRLGELVQDFNAPNESINWGHVGDVSHVCNLLGDVIKLLEGNRK